MVKNVIFDLINVLFECNYKKILLKYYPSTKVDQIIDKFLHHKNWPMSDSGLIEESKFLEIILSENSSFIAKEELSNILKVIRKEIRPIKEGFELLWIAKNCGYQTFLLSNLPFKTFEYIQNNFNIFSLIDGSIISCNVGLVKPNSEIFYYALDYFQININETIFIDDNYNNTESAKSIGLKSYIFYPLPTHINQLKEILLNSKI
ncbi:MAG: HAD-IA family hydrolase [Rickettsiaceae bacterium]|nr:HAD-IA family hydrolase [Rickettsiaceae bacterium]